MKKAALSSLFLLYAYCEPNLCVGQESREPTALGKAIYAHSIHAYSEAKKSYERALELAESKNDIKLKISAYKGLGVLAMNEPDSRTGAENFEKAVELEATLTDVPPAVKFATLSNLGLAYRNLGRYVESEKVYRKALSLAEETGSKAELASVYGHLASLRSRQRRFAEADDFNQRALSYAKSCWGEYNLNTAANIMAWGMHKGHEGKYGEAEALLKRALAIQEKLTGVENCNVAGTGGELAKIYMAQGKLEEAKKLYERSIDTRKKLCGKDDASAGLMSAFLARTYLELGELEKAREAGELSLTVTEKHTGPDHYDLWLQLYTLAAIYEKMGDIAKATEFIERAMKLQRNHKVLLVSAKIALDRGDKKKGSRTGTGSAQIL